MTIETKIEASKTDNAQPENAKAAGPEPRAPKAVKLKTNVRAGALYTGTWD